MRKANGEKLTAFVTDISGVCRAGVTAQTLREIHVHACPAIQFPFSPIVTDYERECKQSKMLELHGV